jgi:hypothetical protein
VPRRALAWSAAAIGAAALLAWLLVLAARVQRIEPEASGTAIPPPSLPAAADPRSAARPHAMAKPPAPSTPLRDRPATAQALQVADDGTEVCGWGSVQLPADDPFPLQRLPAAARRAALDQAQAAMARDADVRVRAAGLLLGARAGAAGARVRIEQLARLAAASTDATTYALALQACQGLADAAGGPCGLLGGAQAAQLEPDNAQPWLALAAEAAARQDTEAEHDAMRRAARASHLSAHAAALPVLVAQALPDPDASLQRTLALGIAMGMQDVARLLPPPGGVAQARAYCLGGGLGGSLAGGLAPGLATGPAAAGAGMDGEPRAASCRALAQLLLQRGRGVAELGAGLDIARRWTSTLPGLVGWQQEHDALIDTAPPLADGIDLGCAAQQRQLDWLHRVADLGERAALREQLAASGHSIAEWSERHRRSLQLAQATVATVAAGADDSPDEAERPTR